MPIGIIANVLAVFFGGLAGALMSRGISTDFRSKLNLVFGVCSMAMGMTSIILMHNMPAVVFSVILGTSIGIVCHVGGMIEASARKLQVVMHSSGRDEAMQVTAIVLFCASGTGIYGVITASMTGDHSILLAKSVLDLFTAMVFACTLGASVCAVAVPQAVIFLSLHFLAKFFFQFTTPEMINDFRACGGIIMLATGFRMIGRDFPIADMIPAMILVMPVSRFWP